MPQRHIGQADLDYCLVLFDNDGNERREQDGSLLSEKLTDIVQAGVTDVFFSSHGWKGDIPAAIRQYDAWIGAMAAQAADREQAGRLDPAFKAMIVGVHWPSLPWGNEDTGAALLGEDEADEFAAEQQMGSGELVRQSLVDELLLYLAPKLLGDKARPLLELPALTGLSEARAFTLIDTQPFGDDLRLRLRPRVEPQARSSD